MQDRKKIKTLLAYHSHSPESQAFYRSYIDRLRLAGYAVEGFNLTLGPPAAALPFPELDRRYREQDAGLFSLYGKLAQKTREFEVLVLFNGVNLHPSFLPSLPTLNAYMCFDDPESSAYYSQPVAKHFQISFVGNIACLNLYASWGCKNVHFRPLGFFHEQLGTAGEKRDIDVCLFCERQSDWRRRRLNYLEKHIPNLYARGKGWPGGYATAEEMLRTYGRAKIGLNLHNSLGPVNLRTYAVPANGMLLVCDNKYFLGQIFKLGREAIGYCDIEEVPGLVKYYLGHETERERIAAAGRRRALSEYNETAVWDKQMKTICELI